MDKIRVVLIEDEQYAAEGLLDTLGHCTPPTQVLAVLDSLSRATDWFTRNPAPDLILADIQLGDGLSFHLFERLNIAAPVIFTTAFDAYAIKAFQVNSVHYLLKPVDPAALQQALDKFMQTRPEAPPAWRQLMEQLKPSPVYRSRFAVTQGTTLSYVDAADIAYFEGDDRYVMLIARDGRRYIIDYLLRDLEGLLDPKLFFRLNRSFITHISAIEGVEVLSKSRLAVRLKPAAKREVIVSAVAAQPFREWLDA